jgi:hypothetical protein
VGAPNYICDSIEAYDGSCSIILNGPNYYDQEIEIVSGEIYQYSFFARTDSPDGSIRFQINWLSKEGDLFEVYASSASLGHEWTHIMGYASAPLGSTKANVYILSNNDSAIHVDKAMVSHILIHEKADLIANSQDYTKAPSKELWHQIYRCVNSNDAKCLDFLFMDG